jgi:ribosomal protein L34
MSKHTLSNKSRYSILKLSGFRARMGTYQGRKTIKNRRKKGRKILAIRR